MSRRAKFWMAAAAGMVIAQATASLVLRPTFALIEFSDLAQAILLFSAAWSFVPNALSTRGRPRLFWALMALGLAFWWVYQLLWTYFEVFLRRDVPNPFSGDVVLFLHIVPMMGALALEPHVEKDERRARLGALDFALLLVWWLFLYVFAVMPWQYAHSNELAYSHNLNAVYLTEKIVFLAGLAVVWWRSGDSWKTIYAHLFGASLTYALSSYLANWAIAGHVYYSGSLYDLPLVASMAWITGIGVWAQQARPKQAPAKISQTHGVWVARLGMVAVFSLPLFAAWSMFDASASPQVRRFRLVVSLAAMVVMGGMVFVRQHLLDRELLDLLQASQRSYADLKRLQNQLVQSEKLASLGQLVGGAAHELNNPLTAMLGYSDLLHSTPLSEEQRALAEKLGQQVRRTKALVASLLNFAQQAPAEKTVLDLNMLARTAVRLAEPQLHARNIEVRTQLASGLPPVWGDSNQLLQVCLHIANNATYAMGEGGILQVSSHFQENLAVLEFSDTGPGAVDPERVFDPFYTTRPLGQGAGLGLSACYGIIQEHKGRILCHNRPEGGATFRIELPAAENGGADSAPARNLSQPELHGVILNTTP